MCVYIVSKSCLTFVTSKNIALQDSLSMGFPRQEYWSGLLFPRPGDHPDPGIELMSPVLQVDSIHIYISVNLFQYSCLKIPWTKEPVGL